MKVRSCYRTMHVSIHAHSEVCESLRSPRCAARAGDFPLRRAALPF